jgi:NADH:ubiquinone reductase (non-electrogenic)
MPSPIQPKRVTPPGPPLPRLIIIGSGWAGFYMAEYIDASRYSVTVVSPRRTTAYTPLLASAACGLFNFYLAEDSVRSKSRSAIRFVKANVTGVDFARQACACTPAFDDDPDETLSEFELEYDMLAIAPGCVPNTFGTPGVADHALFMKNVSDAMRVRKVLFDQLEKASLPNTPPERVMELLHVAIVGGGPTGIEMAAELDDLAKHELRDLYPEVGHRLSISIYDVAPSILGSYDRKLHEYANQQLLKRDIRIETSSHIERVEKGAMWTKEKGRVAFGMLVWATGNKNVPLVESLHVRLPEKGLKRVLTDGYLRVYKGKGSDEIYEDVYALGDAADIDGASLPTTAEVAVQKAKYLVERFNAAGTPKELLYKGPFEYKQKALVSYIGSHDGVIEGRADSEGWTGRSAWLAWRSGSVMWTRNWRSRVMILFTWALNAVLGKEIAKI